MAYRYDEYDKSIVIDGWENGIADSPHQGLADMRNVNIISVPGEASVNFATTSKTFTATSGNLVSADSGTNVVTLSGAITADQCIIFSGLSDETKGLTNGTPYWIKTAPTSLTATLKANFPSATAEIDITGNITGTFTSVNMGKPKYYSYDRVLDVYFCIDANGRVWRYGTYWTYQGNTTLTEANGNGIILYSDYDSGSSSYLFVFRDRSIDYMKLSTATWYYNWKPTDGTSGAGYNCLNSIVSDGDHMALIGINDNIVYYCDSHFVGSFYQKDSSAIFDPADTATYTWNQKALTLPTNDRAICLAELGTNLLIGGRLNAIYPWNRTEVVSGLSINNGYSYPILVAENYIWRMITVNTNTYALVGNRGRVYITNGTQAQLYKKIPDHISGTVEPYFEWGGLGSFKNQLYFGVRARTNSGTAITTNGYGGLWAIDLDTSALRLVNKLSYDTYAGFVTLVIPIYITSLSSATPGTGLHLGWDNGASGYGMDQTSANPYTGSQVALETDLIPIGSYDKPRNMARIEYRLTKPMVANESITVNYRTDFSQTWTQVITDNTVGNYSLSGPIAFSNAQWIQFQVILNSTSSTPSFVRLKELRITGIV